MSAKKKMSLEQVLTRIEEIAMLIERPETPLEESLGLYKEGVTLSVECAEKLERVKQEIILLQKSADGLFEKDFNTNHL